MTAEAARTRPGPAREPLRALMVMLVFVPLAPIAAWLRWSPVAVLTLAALAIVPLAGLLGESTERLAARRGAGAGGLINASLGNAAELILSIVGLRAGLPNVVKASLTGSIIGNSLFVLGLAMVAGGTGRERQRFDRTAAGTSSTLLALATIGLVVPAMFHHFAGHAVERAALAPARAQVLEQSLSVEISVVLFAAYLLSLLFSLRTHRHLYAGLVATPGAHGPPAPRATGARLLVTMLAATALIAWMSEILMGTVGEASRALGFSQLFVGVILIAIVGNAAEHSTAVLAALHDRMDLALHIAIGSSIQIALFVAPVLVFLSRLLSPGPMDLLFTPFEVVAVALAVGMVSLVARDGESNWLEGVLLLAVYLVLGIAFYFLP